MNVAGGQSVSVVVVGKDAQKVGFKLRKFGVDLSDNDFLSVANSIRKMDVGVGDAKCNQEFWAGFNFTRLDNLGLE